MSNHLQMALVETILSLHERGWSQRRIVKELGINREMVSRYLESATGEPKPANAPSGSGDEINLSKPANAPPARNPSRT